MGQIFLFKYKNIPVSFSPWFILLLLLLSYNMGSVATCVMFGIGAVLSILAHEFGHALMARKYGLRPQIELQMFGGLTKHDPALSAKQDFLITLMGPLTNLILGGVCFGLFYLLPLIPIPAWLMTYLISFISLMWMINLFWGIFNLLPAKPMDGHKVLGYLLKKWMKPRTAQKVSMVISAVFVVLILLWSMFVVKSMFMIMLSFFFVLANLDGFRELFKGSSESEPEKKPKRLGIQAEALYEKGLVASREHDWSRLELLGHQMRNVSEDGSQAERAYELLTVACTNLGKYEEALKYSERARQTDSVRQAAQRCRNILGE